MPVLILEAGKRVQVNDRLNAALGAEVDDSVEMTEAVLLQLEWSHVVFEVVIVEREPHQVETQRGNERGIVGREEGGEKGIEEADVQVVAPNLAERLTVRLLVGSA